MIQGADKLYRIELLGGLQVVQRGGEETIARFQTRKVGALLAYLAIHTRNPASRDVLAELFWPDTDPEAQRNSLRVALNSLRKQIEPPGIPAGAVLLADRSTVRLNPDAFSTDVAAFDEALRSEKRAETLGGETARTERIAALSNATELYRGPLLPGFYEEWADLERERLSEAYAGALQRLTALLWDVREYERAVELARRAVKADPLREESHRLLIRLYAALGRRGDALRQFRELESVLQDELGEAPSAATRALVRDLGEGSPALSPPSPLPHAVGEGGERKVPVGDTPAASHSPSPTPPSPTAWGRGEGGERAPERPATHSRSFGNVPQPFTRFFGREIEMAALLTYLSPEETTDREEGLGGRLVTLTGPGGAGKTRLALEAAAHLRPEYGGRVAFVPLGDVSGAAQIAPAVATALRLHGSPDADPMERLREALAEGPALLVFDNFEQIAEEGAAAVGMLLAEAPDLRCLVTSRQRLDVDGEQEIPLAPLPVPEISGSGSEAEFLSPEALFSVPSVRLFVDRAQAIRPDFQITPRNAAAIATLSARLEGIPLAIELAAAWAQVLTPAQMVERLEQAQTGDNGGRFDLLTSERRNLPARHRSLRAVLDESLRLLSDNVQHFFARLSVFRGGWTLEAAEAICTGSQETGFLLSLPMITEGLRVLRQHSLVSAEASDEGVRFRMLETVREYATTICSPKEARLTAERHAAHYLALAEEARPCLNGSNAEVWLRRLDAEQDNLRAAFTTLTDRQEHTAALRLSAALWPFWYARGRARTGTPLLQQALSTPSEDTSPILRADALLGAGRLCAVLGESLRACGLLSESLELWRQVSATPAVASPETEADPALLLSARRAAAMNLALVARDQSDLETARLAYTDLLAATSAGATDEEPDPWERGWTLSELGGLALETGDPVTARTLLAESADLREAAGDTWGAAETRLGLATALDALQEQPAAGLERQKAEAAPLASALAAAFLSLGHIAATQGDAVAGRALFADARTGFAQADDPVGEALALERMASIAAFHQGDLTAARTAAEACLELRRQATTDGDAALLAQQRLARARRLLAAIAGLQGDTATVRALQGGPLSS